MVSKGICHRVANRCWMVVLDEVGRKVIAGNVCPLARPSIVIATRSSSFRTLIWPKQVRAASHFSASAPDSQEVLHLYDWHADQNRHALRNVDRRYVSAIGCCKKGLHRERSSSLFIARPGQLLSVALATGDTGRYYAKTAVARSEE